MNHAALLALALPLLSSSPAAGQDTSQEGPLRFGDPTELAYEAAFFPGANYDTSVPTPEAIYGRRAGDRLAHHAEVVACFEAWAAASDRVLLREHGRTHEGRPLVHALITSPENHARLDAIVAGHQKLDDPRGQDAAELARLVNTLPAVAWMGYSIHGDEVSGSDAAVALGYHLAASTEASVVDLLDNLVIVIDPMLNPDGRERIIGMVEQAAGRAPVLDHASMHRGRWPFGRGNHYLFDMNRDWMAGTQPETRARWTIARAYHPQLFVDAHEMGALDTYLFYPQATPINPELPPRLVEWQRRYAEGAANAFDALGWSYYTREWADGWAPFYSDSWGSLLGATGMLYEQASSRGLPLRKASGRIERYRETVHHQVAASWANLLTLQANRREALNDQLAFARSNVDATQAGNGRALVFTTTGNRSREERFLDILAGQGIEVLRSGESELELTSAERWDGTQMDKFTLPAGSYIVPSAQPRGPMVKAYLSFDVRMDDASLLRERESLERTGSSKIYDLTSWSLPLAFGLDATWVDMPAGDFETMGAAPTGSSRLVPHGNPDSPTVGWAVDGRDDASVAFAVRALEEAFIVHFADEPFRLDSTAMERGSLLIQVAENSGEPAALEARLLAIAKATGVTELHRASTGLANPIDPGSGEVDPDEPDHGGGHFHQLARPRVGILANAPVQSDVFGHLWWLLDHELGISATQLDVQSMWAYDLRRFDVIVAPPGGLRSELKETLDGWVRGGGTLIAMGSSAAAATSGNLGLSEVTLRRDALEDLDDYARLVEREVAARSVTIDSASVWGDPVEEREKAATEEDPEENPGENPGENADKEEQREEVSEEDDAWARRFAPFGVSVRAYADPRHWLTAGISSEGGTEVPVHVNGSHVFLAPDSAETALRLEGEERLRLSGLAWPEARERLAKSAWATVEGRGRGQVILFADVPGYRGYHLLTARILANAVVYGPGLGTSQPVPR
ncbi:MAG: hypothetical protein ACI9K5_000074 [Gammaproteobacteria bacterium]|jgi:hypothetical protein